MTNELALLGHCSVCQKPNHVNTAQFSRSVRAFIQAADGVGVTKRRRVGSVEQSHPVADSGLSRLTVHTNAWRWQLRASHHCAQSVADRTACHPWRRARMPTSSLTPPRKQLHLGLSSFDRSISVKQNGILKLAWVIQTAGPCSSTIKTD